MSGLTAGESLEYALDEEFLKLYGVTCVGALFGLLAGVGLIQNSGTALSVLFFLLSPPVVLVGVVSTFRKLLYEST